MRAIIVAAVLVALSEAALAETPPVRTVDMTTAITDMDGKPIHDSTQQNAKDAPFTLGRAVALALCADRPEDKGLAAVDKAKRCALGLRVMDDKQAALTAAEADQIIKSAGILSPIVAVRLVGLIDPAAMKP